MRSAESKEGTSISRIEYPGAPNARGRYLEAISCKEFLERFDESKLVLLYQEETGSGQRNNFNGFVGRETAEAREHGERHGTRHHGRR